MMFVILLANNFKTNHLRTKETSRMRNLEFVFLTSTGRYADTILNLYKTNARIYKNLEFENKKYIILNQVKLTILYQLSIIKLI